MMMLLKRLVIPENVRRSAASLQRLPFLSFSSSSTRCANNHKENNSNIYQGVFPILVTPFRDNETIDLDSFRRTLEFMDAVGVAGVTIAGVLGESNRMTDWERQMLVETAVEFRRESSSSKLKLCVGATHTGTAATVALSQMAFDLGADGVMISPTKDGLSAMQPSDDEIWNLYDRVSTACPNLSIILQDLPSQSGVHLSLDLLTQIATTVPNVRSIKLESLPTVNRLLGLHSRPEFESSGCTILTGLGALYAGYDLQHGTNGFMTGFAFPEILMALHNLAKAGDWQGVHRVYAKYLPLIVLEQQPGAGLAIRKEIYKRRGLIDASKLRRPGNELSIALQRMLQDQLDRSFPGVDLTKPIAQDDILPPWNLISD